MLTGSPEGDAAMAGSGNREGKLGMFGTSLDIQAFIPNRVVRLRNLQLI